MANHFSEFDSFNIPPELKPMGAWAYIGLSILYSIPVIGLIFVVVFSFSDANINRRNYSRSYLFIYLILFIIILALFFTGALTGIIQQISSSDWQSSLRFLPWIG